VSEQFAKLFETPHGQLLVTRDYDAVEDKYELVVRNGDGTVFRMSGWEDDEASSREGLAKTDQAMADKHAATLHNARKGLAQ
jgi:hypothetical protein